MEGESNELKILRYPKGCELFSLSFDEDRKSLIGQEEWLKNLVSRIISSAMHAKYRVCLAQGAQA
jgi:hypothetical protein